MKIKKLVHIALILSLIFLMAGCSALDMMVGLKEENIEEKDEQKDNDLSFIDNMSEKDAVDTITINSNQEKKAVTLYYKNNEKLLIPVKANISWEEGIAKAALSKMIIGSDLEKEMTQSDLSGVLPEGTEIMGMSINEGLCVVDFNNNVLNSSSYEEEEMMMTAITYALTEFDTIDMVEIMVDGKSISTLTNGYPVDVVSERQNINLLGKADGANFVVYYKTPETEIEGYYVPFTFTANNVDNPVKIVLSKLFEGVPEDYVVSNNIPYDITLNDASIEDGVVSVDLSMDALNLEQEDYDELNEIVVLCLNQFGDISKIDYTIEGITFEEANLDIKNQEVKAVFNEHK